MSISNCPGAKGFRQPQPEDMKCSSCGETIEIWTDEIQANCPKCSTKVMRELEGATCLDWCKYAKECVGDQTYVKYMKNKAITLKQKLIKELEDYFGNDQKRINHANKVMDYAEELLKKEGGDWHIVIPASILHDVGIKVAEEKHGSSAGNYQEKEGPAVARKILLKLEFKKEDIDEICEIVAHHHTPGKVDTQNFKILYDSDWLVNFKDEVSLTDREKLEKMIDKIFLTVAGKEMARKIYLKVS